MSSRRVFAGWVFPGGSVQASPVQTRSAAEMFNNAFFPIFCCRDPS
ncbi:DUF1317 family protein [Polaromonas sp.]